MWLVQRIKKKFGPPEPERGVDGFFAMDYMGSAEFEWGALPNALKVMRETASSSSEKIVLKKVKHVTMSQQGKKQVHKAYFVGPASILPRAQMFFIGELEGVGMRHKEPTFIRSVYVEKNDFCSRTIGWWVLEDQPPWALFKEDPLARQWKKVVYERL